MNKTLTAANDNDAILLLDGDEISGDAMIDPGMLVELTSGLRISHRYIVAHTWSAEQAASYRCKGFTVIVTKKSFSEALHFPDLAARIGKSRRIFIGGGTVEAVLRFARELSPRQRISLLARERDGLPTSLRSVVASVLFIDAATVPLPPALLYS